jgi:hypothetical protein
MPVCRRKKSITPVADNDFVPPKGKWYKIASRMNKKCLTRNYLFIMLQKNKNQNKLRLAFMLGITVEIFSIQD